jgi:DNA-binding LacI/PurR family transcriptional regulator
MDHVVRYPNRELVIEAACHLIDDGCDVYGIGTGPLTDSMGKHETAGICALWARAEHPSASR